MVCRPQERDFSVALLTLQSAGLEIRSSAAASTCSFATMAADVELIRLDIDEAARLVIHAALSVTHAALATPNQMHTPYCPCPTAPAGRLTGTKTSGIIQRLLGGSRAPMFCTCDLCDPLLRGGQPLCGHWSRLRSPVRRHLRSSLEGGRWPWRRRKSCPLATRSSVSGASCSSPAADAQHPEIEFQHDAQQQQQQRVRRQLQQALEQTHGNCQMVIHNPPFAAAPADQQRLQ